jgi:hypothetical protein
MTATVAIQTYEVKTQLNLVQITSESLKDKGLANLLTGYGYKLSEYIPYGKTEVERYEIFLFDDPSAQYHQANLGDYIIFSGLRDISVMTAKNFEASKATRIS